MPTSTITNKSGTAAIVKRRWTQCRRTPAWPSTEFVIFGIVFIYAHFLFHSTVLMTTLRIQFLIPVYPMMRRRHNQQFYTIQSYPLKSIHTSQKKQRFFVFFVSSFVNFSNPYGQLEISNRTHAEPTSASELVPYSMKVDEFAKFQHWQHIVNMSKSLDYNSCHICFAIKIRITYMILKCFIKSVLML